MSRGQPVLVGPGLIEGVAVVRSPRSDSLRVGCGREAAAHMCPPPPSTSTLFCPAVPPQALIDATRVMVSARRLLAHAAILAFLLDAGLNRQRLEFAGADLDRCTDRLATELKAPFATTDRVCDYRRTTVTPPS